MTETVMPVLFVGHGSPTNAIEDNEFSRGFGAAAEAVPRPAAVLCISAHWETEGVRVTAMERPRTIHDFFGFPRQLYAIAYPASGQPALAKEIQELLKPTQIGLDTQWGLDHGCWSVLRHMYPNADVPVVQLALDRKRSAQQHYDLACALAPLRRKGVLIVASGNIVHNLRLLNWDDMHTPHDWAAQADAELARRILVRDHHALIEYRKLGAWAGLAIPTAEHYLPLLYALGLQEDRDKVRFFNEKVMSSISMRSLVLEDRR